MTFAAGTLAGALVRLAWVLVIALVHDGREPEPYELTSLPRATLVR